MGFTSVVGSNLSLVEHCSLLCLKQDLKAINPFQVTVLEQRFAGMQKHPIPRKIKFLMSSIQSKTIKDEINRKIGPIIRQIN